MENNNITFIEGENLTLREADNSTSTEFTMQNEDTVMENPKSTDGYQGGRRKRR
jgi:hypothetical protein